MLLHVPVVGVSVLPPPAPEARCYNPGMNIRAIPGSPRVNYALMLHVPTYRLYAFRFAVPGMVLTGVSGPRDKDEWRRTPLEGVEYDEGELRAWAEARLSEFDLTG